MIDAASQAVLQDILRRESRSFLAYIGDAFPWTTAAGGPAAAELNRLVKREVAAVTGLGRFLVKRKVMPNFIASYPAAFTACNFIALGWVVPRLLELQRQAIAELQADLAKVADEPSKQEAERLLGVKRETLAGLETLQEQQLAPASV